MRLKDELNSEEFLSGLEAAINFSIKSGRETGFEVNYERKTDSFVYPNQIYIGDETSTFVNRTMGEEEIRKKFTEETGHPFPSFGNPEYAKLSDKDKAKCLVALSEWKKNYEADVKKTRSISYPLTSKLVQRIHDRIPLQETGSEEESFPDPDECETDDYAITLHTHPNNRLLIPSEKDLRHLNFRRRDNYLNGSKLNPVELIAGTKEKRYDGIPGKPTGFSILAVQEEPEGALDASTDWEIMRNGFLQYFTDPLVQFFGMVSKGSPAWQTINNYRLVSGVYVPKEKRIISLTKGDFSCLK